jgi:hypothetical protein
MAIEGDWNGNQNFGYWLYNQPIGHQKILVTNCTVSQLVIEIFRSPTIQTICWQPKKFDHLPTLFQRPCGCCMGMPSNGNQKNLGTHNFTYKELHIFIFPHFLFNMYNFDGFGQLVRNILKEMGEGTPCTIFCYFCNFNFFCKTKYVEQSSWRSDNQAGLWMGWQHHHDLGLWRGRCYIFPRPRRQIWCGYFLIIEGLIVQARIINIICQN